MLSTHRYVMACKVNLTSLDRKCKVNFTSHNRIANDVNHYSSVVTRNT